MGLSNRTFSGSGAQRLCCLLCALAMVFAGLPLFPQTAYADRYETVANPEYEAALAELDRIASEYTALAEQQAETYSQLEEVRNKIADNEAQIADVQQEIDDKQVELEEKQRLLAGHVSADYKSGGMSLLSIILSSSTFEEAVSRAYYYNAISEAQVSEIDDINVLRHELSDRRAELDKLESELQEQEASIETLYDEQREQTEAMQAQQVAAAEWLNSLPSEIQILIEEEDEELIDTAQAVANTEEEEKKEEKSSNNNSNSNNNNSNNNGNNNNSNNNNNGGNNNSSNNNNNGGNNNPTTPTSGGSMQAVLNAAYSTGGGEALSNGWGCAGWVYCVYRNSGVYNRKPRCAAWYYENWCFSSNRADLQPGMVIAVSTWTGTSAGRIYGHCGIYVGNNTVRHLSAGAVREMSLDQWIRRYGTTVTPMWGWVGGIALS